MRHFNVSVYGILIDKNKVLVSDEYIKGKYITKFPGGGLEFGEGTVDCIKREFKEELDLDIEISRHFYTTDFFVASAFNSNSQVISIYYLVSPVSGYTFKQSDKPYDFKKTQEGAQALRWINLKVLKEDNFTFIIDKRVAEMLAKTKF